MHTTHGSSHVGQTPSRRDMMLETLVDLIHETTRLRREGAAYGKLSHACGYADGYMKLMLDAGFVSPKELVKVVDEARRGH